MHSQSADTRFTRFIVASGVTNLADGIAVVVWAWMASLLSRDPLYIALMPVALRLPWFVFALPAGIVTDRTDRRRLILTMDCVRAIVFALATLMVWVSLPLKEAAAVGTDSPVLFFLLLTCAFVIGTAEVFRDNAAQTMLPALVAKHDLERANGRLWSLELVGNSLLGPALGAFLIATQIWLPFAVNTVAFIVATWIIYSLGGQFLSAQSGQRNWMQELREGFSFLRGRPLLKLLAVVTGVWNMLHQMVLIALVLHVQENLTLDVRGYGLILAFGAIGGIAGALIAGRVIKVTGRGRAVQWMSLASAAAFMIIPLAPNAVILALVLAAFECSGVIWNTVSVSYRQRIIPDHLLGRVNSIYRLFAWGMMPVGLLLSGLVVNGAEIKVSRELALTMPFFFAAAGAWLLTAVAWRALGTGFSVEDSVHTN